MNSQSKLFLPYDTYERHRKIGELIPDGQTVLDVGGELNHLSQFCHPAKIVVANLKDSQEQSDILIKKGKLPFSKNSFDIACSIDVLEHIPIQERGEFVKNLLTVAKQKIILSFPIGTEKHLRYETKMLAWLKKHGKNVKYLEEHVKYQIPTKEQIDNITKGLKTKIEYSGDISINEYLFRLFIFDPKIKFVSRIVYFLKLGFNLLTNEILYRMLTNKGYSQNVNRAYVIITKEVN